MLAAHDRKTVCAPAHVILARKGPENLRKWREIPGLVMFMALPCRGWPPFYCQITPPLAVAAGIIWLGKEQTERKPTRKPVAAQVPHHHARPGVLRHAKHSRQRCGCIEFSASASHIAVFCPGKLGKLDISIFSVCCCCPIWFCNSGQTGHAVGGMNRSNQGICITPAAKHIAPFAPKARQIMRRLARVTARVARQQQTLFQ